MAACALSPIRSGAAGLLERVKVRRLAAVARRRLDRPGAVDDRRQVRRRGTGQQHPPGHAGACQVPYWQNAALTGLAGTSPARPAPSAGS
jgi:hypothetical protein